MRFLLHEMDLAGPIVRIGRGESCHITLDDALVSRDHAVIRLGPDGAHIRDLQSRNGVLVNGARIQQEVPLKDRDRVRIGAQEMVFCVAAERQALPHPGRATGQMILCQACAVPYPTNSSACPHCGAPQPGEEVTRPHLDVKQNRDWALTLLAESVERALATGDHNSAERAMTRSAAEIDMAAQARERLNERLVDLFAVLGLRLAGAMQHPRWMEWSLSTLMQQSMTPSAAVAARLDEILASPLVPSSPVLPTFAAWWESRVGEAEGDHADTLGRLKRTA